MSYVYCLVERGTGRVKVGFSMEPYRRAKSLPQDFDLDASYQVQVSDGARAERLIHKALARYAIPPDVIGPCSGNTEWFDTPARTKMRKVLKELPNSLQCGRPMPVLQQTVSYGVRLPEPLKMKLKWLSENVKPRRSVHDIALDMLEMYVEDSIKKWGYKEKGSA